MFSHYKALGVKDDTVAHYLALTTTDDVQWENGLLLQV
jgi:hypothetical protein